MPISVFEMFRVGIGPSSSHTVGPMRAAAAFSSELLRIRGSERTSRITVDLMGSLGATGRGHSTDSAVMLGLGGARPESIPPRIAAEVVSGIRKSRRLRLWGGDWIDFDPEADIAFSPEKVARFHTNALHITAFDAGGGKVLERRYYSVGGGFFVTARDDDFEEIRIPKDYSSRHSQECPHPYRNASGLVSMAEGAGRSIAGIVRENELAARTGEEIDRELDRIRSVMEESIDRGLAAEGDLPGPLRVKRRARRLQAQLTRISALADPLAIIDAVNAWAFAVGEENASGGRIVTCPTNGAAAVVPAVMRFYTVYGRSVTDASVRDFLLTAGAIGMLYKENASISGAEVGCQGEVGVACSMAAGALTAVSGGTPRQVENAAEIAMEHCLGLTCDPVGGQVQIPCIERNAVAAVKAVNASRLAMAGSGEHVVSLDEVMRTMFETGRDMQTKYKETSRGGLAVCIHEC